MDSVSGDKSKSSEQLRRLRTFVRLLSRRRIKLHDMPKSHRIGLVALSWVIALLITSLMSLVSVFGFKDASEAASRDIFFSMIAPFYPGSSDRDVTVVLINDDSIQNIDVYPVKYSTHALFLNSLLSYNPAAVFIDFAFIDERDDNTIIDLIRTLEDFHRAGVPVYVPLWRSVASPKLGIRSDLAKLAEKGIIRPVSFELGRKILGVPSYKMFDKKNSLPTVAAKILDDFRPNTSNEVRSINEFEIWWGQPTDRFNCRIVSIGDCRLGKAYTLMRWLNASIDATSIFSGDKSDKINISELPYVPFFFAKDSLQSANRDALERVLRRRFVFYGPDFELVRDLFSTPVSSFRAAEKHVLPGVFFHATALQNLIDFGRDVLRAQPQNNLAKYMSSMKIIFLVSVVVFLLRFIPFVDRRRDNPLYEIGLIMVCGVIVVFTFLFWLRQSPSNWVGALTILAFARSRAVENFAHWLIFRVFGAKVSDGLQKSG